MTTSYTHSVVHIIGSPVTDIIKLSIVLNKFKIKILNVRDFNTINAIVKH